MDAADRIEHSVEDDAYYEQGAYDKAMQEQFIEPYEENYFWDEWMDRLGRRDVIERIGMAAYEALDIKERIQAVELAKEKYANEFEQHGLAALKIIREKPAH